jgi:hypothetical protein
MENNKVKKQTKTNKIYKSETKFIFVEETQSKEKKWNFIDTTHEVKKKVLNRKEIKIKDLLC